MGFTCNPTTAAGADQSGMKADVFEWLFVPLNLWETPRGRTSLVLDRFKIMFVRQKGLIVEKRLGFCLKEQSHLISPLRTFSAWVTDCPAAVTTLSQHTTDSQEEVDGQEISSFYSGG